MLFLEPVPLGYVQFIPVCTAHESTSYEYTISLNHRNTAFDVYFVPSRDEMINYLKFDSFRFYAQEGCLAQNYIFSGICKNVEKNSGLLIVIPDNLEQALTKVKISIHETLYNANLLVTNPA